MVEHSPHHPKFEGLNLATVTHTGRGKIVKMVTAVKGFMTEATVEMKTNREVPKEEKEMTG